jgi:hypothetical protein
VRGITGAAAEDKDARAISPIEHVPRDLRNLRELDDHRVPVVRSSRAVPDLAQPVAQDAHGPQRAGRAFAPAGAVTDFERAIVGVGDVVVGDDEVVNGHVVPPRPGVHGLRKVLERVVTDADALAVPQDPNRRGIAFGLGPPAV